MTTPDINTICENLRNLSHIRILFVCLGNICRSPAADGMMHDIVKRAGDEKRWTIDSAGTGGYHIGDLPDSRMRVHARRRGIELNHICRKVRESDFDNFDLIVAMDASNERNLRNIAPSVEAEAKIVQMAAFLTSHPWFDHIPDPYYEGDQGFETVLDLLDDGCNSLFRLCTPQN